MKYSIYRLSDGMIVDSKESDESHVKQNVPAGHGYILGHHDYLSQRVNVDFGVLIYYQPPQPSPDHEWNDVSKRWNLSARAHESSMAKKQIERLELKLLRPLRELSIDPSNIEAKRARDEIEARCAELRKTIQQTR